MQTYVFLTFLPAASGLSLAVSPRASHGRRAHVVLDLEGSSGMHTAFFAATYAPEQRWSSTTYPTLAAYSTSEYLLGSPTTRKLRSDAEVALALGVG